jgi:hypothetical protein
MRTRLRFRYTGLHPSTRKPIGRRRGGAGAINSRLTAKTALREGISAATHPPHRFFSINWKDC